MDPAALFPTATPQGSAAEEELDPDEDDEDEPSDAGEECESPNKKRKVKENRAYQARKAQNRVAQREFRQRKQAYVRDLEARIQLMSSPPTEQVDILIKAVVAIIAENKQLRSLLSSVTGFIGQDMGGCLSEIGLKGGDLESLLKRGDSDAAYEAVVKHRQEKEKTGKSCGKRSVDSNIAEDRLRPRSGGSAPIRRRSSEVVYSMSHSGIVSPSLPTLAAPLTSIDPMAAYTSQNFALDTSLFGDIFHMPPDFTHVNGSGIFASPGAHSPMPTGKPAVSNHLAGVPGLDDDIHDELGVFFQLSPSDPNITRVMETVAFHLRNKRQHPQYLLPKALEYTPLQLSTPHDRLIDGVLWPSVRERMISLQSRYNVEVVLGDMLGNVELHSKDGLDTMNWELKEPFLRKYWPLIDNQILNCCNLWRLGRGEPRLTMADLSGNQATN